MAVRKKRGMSGEQSKCFQPLAGPISPGASGTWQASWLVPGTSPSGMQGSKAPGGMCSNSVLFLPVTYFPSAMTEYLLLGVLPTQASFSCERPDIRVVISTINTMWFFIWLILLFVMNNFNFHIVKFA